ncbi:[weak similarity to] glycosyltransferase [methanotrophic bacterial endosymbiont of Bathymodiolus sp.]|nr:[weak similarity to] glycosyltransferase [methanotrophic bacterial endosymbiont of Bathymodiolus sp.]
MFDGWSDLYRFKEKLGVLQDVKPYGLKIVDSKKEIFKNKLKEFPDYTNEILGCVSEAGRRTLLKYSKTVVSFEESLLTPTTQQWDALEVAATRTNLLYRGTIEDQDIRKDIVIEAKTDSDLLLMLASFKEDDLYQERLAHKAWRGVNQNHTFNNRLRAIGKSLKIKFKQSVHKKASIITPTYRTSHMMQSIKIYQQQAHKNKELILIYNGNELIPNEIGEFCRDNDDVTLIKLPPENSVGACLNIGHNIATGDYCFRVDDDIYAPNYILDMMLHLRLYRWAMDMPDKR